MLRFGSDKPDLRFGMEIQDATEVTRGSEFGVFKNAPCVRYVVVPKTFSRTEHEKLEGFAKEWGAKGLAMPVADLEVPLRSRARVVRRRRGRDGALRRRRAGDGRRRCSACSGSHLANELGLDRRDLDVFHWVVDFPLFERDEESGGWTFMHHPFTAAAPGTEAWDESNPVGVRGQHYDLVWNGWELGSGSIRIHEAEVQQAVFRMMGLGEEEQRDKFGFLLDALRWARRRTAGSRWASTASARGSRGEPDIRQVTAFPKVSSGTDPLTGAPTPYTGRGT